MNKAYENGVKGFETGMRVSQNPYPRGSSSYRLWKQGWMNAKNGGK